MGDDIDVTAVYRRSVTLLEDSWLSRRAERSFRAAERALDEWHRLIASGSVPAPDGHWTPTPRSASRRPRTR
jgi:hypothetical protein